jgi:hypothetical protein
MTANSNKNGSVERKKEKKTKLKKILPIGDCSSYWLLGHDFCRGMRTSTNKNMSYQLWECTLGETGPIGIWKKRVERNENCSVVTYSYREIKQVLPTLRPPDTRSL